MMASDMLEAVKAERRPVLTPADADQAAAAVADLREIFHRHLVPYGRPDQGAAGRSSAFHQRRPRARRQHRGPQAGAWQPLTEAHSAAITDLVARKILYYSPDAPSPSRRNVTRPLAARIAAGDHLQGLQRLGGDFHRRGQPDQRHRSDHADRPSTPAAKGEACPAVPADDGDRRIEEDARELSPAPVWPAGWSITPTARRPCWSAFTRSTRWRTFRPTCCQGGRRTSCSATRSGRWSGPTRWSTTSSWSPATRTTA